MIRIRIKRKLIFLICGILFIIFLFLYGILSQTTSAEKPANLSYIEDKIKQLENGLHQHNKEVGEIKRQINTIKVKNVNEIDDSNNRNKNKEMEMQIQYPKLNNREMIKDSVINAVLPFKGDDQRECAFQFNTVPKPNIQMLDIYNSLPFDNPDGGPWKQGWRIEYNSHEWNRNHKLKVFVVPHSHNDPGWLKTFDEYYEQSTKSILTNMLSQLTENSAMTFIWAEISYFSRWYEKLNSQQQRDVKNILKTGQLEFVTGGWVMPDEANSHWLAILQQLTEGNTWLKINLNVTPTSSWAIDPFGHSPVMPLLLKGSRIQNLLIQRTHYSIKKRLAQKNELEFRWRQTWDNNGDTELFTHMMPFYSYDVPHTCGPDPKVCCQFDFKRLPGYGLTCPWKIPPQPIDDNNVAKKAELIIDQWRKKSVLFKTKSVLIPLGDDFRYSQSTEWEAQRTNFERLFDYINNEESLNVEAKFSTLQDYFDSVRSEKNLVDFPSLSGDFFTYADRDDHYWSGYFTSRPYHKRLDRILLTYLRSAEMLYAWQTWDSDSGLHQLLSESRRALSLYQHHDGIPGTAKDHVMRDYANQMLTALKACKFVIQQAAYRFLTQEHIYEPDYKFTYFNIDDSRTSLPDDNRPTIILGEEIPIKYIVLHNSLPRYREEIVEFYVSKPFVMVTDTEKNTIPSQVTPVWSWHKGLYNALAPQPSNTKFRILFKARVPPLGLATYMIHATSSIENSFGTTFAKITIFTDTPFTANLPDYPYQVEFAEPQDKSLRLHEDTTIGASFNSYGLLKSMSTGNNGQTMVPIHLEFLKYGARTGNERSGAYLFLPDGPAVPLPIGNPTVLHVEGTIESSITTGLPFVVQENILREKSFEIRNLVDIGDMGNTEIIMRLSTDINSQETFYTDLNGLQIIKRKRFNKLPLQANYYPIPSAMFIEDDTTRLTLLTGQPLGGSSLASGQIEIMQDRRLIQDDNRGLGQGVLDNRPVLNIFRIILENIESCTKHPNDYPAAYHTVTSHTELQTLLHPMEKLVWHDNDWSGVLPTYGDERESFEDGMELAVLRNLPHVTNGPGGGGGAATNSDSKSTLGIVIHRNYLEECTIDSHRTGTINIRQLLNIDETRTIYNAPLTLLQKESLLTTTDYLNVCPMEIKAFIANR